MKNLKKIFLLIILFAPLLVLAEGPSAEDKLALIPTYTKSDKEYLDIKIMNFDNYSNVCDWEKDGDCEDITNPLESWNVISLALNNKGIKTEEIISNVSQTNYKFEVDKENGKVTISAYDGYPDEPWNAIYNVSKEYYIEFQSKITNNKVDKMVSKIENKEFKLTGNQYLNMMANINDFEIEDLVGNNIGTFISYYP